MSNDLPRSAAQRTKLQPDHRVARLAARQHGVVAVAQLRQTGLSRHEIAGAVRAGWLHRLHRGVYAVGHTGITDAGRDLAAVLACGEGAVLSHASAAALWKLCRRPAGDVHVLVPRRTRRRKGIWPHEAPLPPGDVTLLDGIPVTTPERTLFDYADVRGRAALRRALEAAERAGLVDRTTLVQRPGRRRVVEAPHRFTRSGVERRFLRLLRENGIELPETNQDLHGWEVDCLWRAQRVVVEIDVYATHFDRVAFERDRLKQNDLEQRGYRVRRITDVQIATAPLQVIGTVVAALGLER